MRVVRDDFLHSLERVQCGLSQGEGVEQATSFIFKGGQVHAFNKKLYCSSPCPSPAEGAVPARPLLLALRKLTAEELEVSQEENHLCFRYGKKLKYKIALKMESTIALPFDTIDEPRKWKPLHESFSDALSLVQECAGKDRGKYVCMCVHVHPEFLEAFDGVQGMSYSLKTGVRNPCLVEREVLKHVVASGVDEIGETDSWLHFRGAGIRMACLRMADPYPDLEQFYRNKGKRISLPASLAEHVEVCEIFSSEEKDANMIMVEIGGGEMKLMGRGASGKAEAYPVCDYDGPPVKFCLSPTLLKGLSEKSNEAFIGDGKLWIEGGKWQYVTALGVVEQRENAGEVRKESRDGRRKRED